MSDDHDHRDIDTDDLAWLSPEWRERLSNDDFHCLLDAQQDARGYDNSILDAEVTRCRTLAAYFQSRTAIYEREWYRRWGAQSNRRNELRNLVRNLSADDQRWLHYYVGDLLSEN